MIVIVMLMLVEVLRAIKVSEHSQGSKHGMGHKVMHQLHEEPGASVSCRTPSWRSIQANFSAEAACRGGLAPAASILAFLVKEGHAVSI